MAITVKGNTSSVVYGKGDICLKINPFDNFRLFTLYEDWRSDDRKPIDLSNGQKIYLVFRSKNKEIRIPEYDMIDSDYTVDKVNGQVLFKIPKKQAVDILSLDNRVFYITRVYDVTDYTGEKILSSDEEVLYTGQWKDETSNTVDNYTSQLKNLMGIVEDRNKQIKDLQDANVKLMEQNANFATSLNTLQEEYDKLLSDYNLIEAKLTEYESGNEYSGTVVGEGTHHTVITGLTLTGENVEFTEEQMAAALKNLEVKKSE
jgi:hypothetical protein